MVFKNAISAISGFHLNEKGIPLQGSLIRKKKQFLFPKPHPPQFLVPEKFGELWLLCLSF